MNFRHFYPLKPPLARVLARRRARSTEKELPTSKWMAQYQQNPTSEVSAIVKREWWKVWEKDDPPNCDYIIQSWDTAFLKSERADYSACTTWGIFYPEEIGDDRNAHIILLNAFKDRLEFPELKQRAYENWEEWEPDSLIVEAKAAGSPLIYELRLWESQCKSLVLAEVTTRLRV